MMKKFWVLLLLPLLLMAQNNNQDQPVKSPQEIQQELADEFYKYEENNPKYIISEIRKAFDYMEEGGFTINFKVIFYFLLLKI